MELKTGQKTMNGIEIRLGDVIKSSRTANYVVLKDNETIVAENEENEKDFWQLSTFLRTFEDTQIIGSVLDRTYQKNKRK